MPAKKKTDETLPDTELDHLADDINAVANEPDDDSDDGPEEVDTHRGDDDLKDVPQELRFDTDIDEDASETNPDDPHNQPIPITINGVRFSLNPPDEAALSVRMAEMYTAATLADQILAMQGVISTSLDRAGYMLIRQQMLGLRVPGKKFNPELIGRLCELILNKWGGGRKLPERIDQDKPVGPPPQNRAERRASSKKSRR